MNPYLEQICRWFGPYSCGTASVTDYLIMAFSAALACLFAYWLAGKIIANASR